MIQVERLYRRFGELIAVDSISFEVKDGEIFGLLGPNGAGKTTSINMICGVLKPDGGRVLIDGEDIWLNPRKVKKALSVVPQEIAVYEDLTARDNLNFWGSLYELRGSKLKSRVDEAMTRAVSLFEPLLLVLMGSIIAFLLLAMYLPIFQLAG